jgi:predicted TPR repeat methyltransferase
MILALGKTPASFDLVLAVDALGYVGDLAQVFRAAGRALRRPGWFAATVEENDGSEGFDLGPARRFRHGADYLRRAAEAVGFDLLALEKTVLRRDRGEPVAGLAFVLSA